MTELFRILKLLIYKNLLTRKRQWKISLFGEIIIPVGLIMCVWAVRNLSAEPPTHFENNTYFNNVPKEDMLADLYYNEVFIYFAPNNSFTKLLIQKVTDCLRLNPNNITINGYTTEDELVRNYQETKIGQYSKIAAVIFDDRNINASTKHLSYKIRTNNLYLTELYNIFFLTNIYNYYKSVNMFVPLQICLDESFIKLQTKNILFEPQVFVQRLPYPPYVQQNVTDSIIRQLFTAVIILAFMLPLFIETSKASSEKFFGIHILMSMNGVSSALNLFSWLISGIAFVNLFCIVPIVILLLYSTGDVLPYANYANSFIIWLAFTCHIAHLFSYGVHISAYFSKFLLVIFGLLALNVCSVVIQLYGLKEEDYLFVPYLGIFFPNMLMSRIIEELNYYENTGEGIQWNNIFLVGNSAYKIGGSIGMVLLLSIIGMIFHYLMAIYVYAIHPGKYGVKKHPLFFLQTKSKTYSGNYLENLAYDGLHKELFESVPEQIYIPGIQMRNLKKSYNVGLFNKTQVHALQGVSIDFYKGHITSLLGHNGAGKTTMMSILTGMMSPSDGLVLINSKNIKDHSTEIMNDMGLCPQDNILFQNLTVEEQLLFFAMLKSKGNVKDEIEQNLKIFLKKLKLYDKRKSLPRELSGGQKRRVCLGMALIGDSSTLILDEPTSGLDPKSRRIIWDILLKMRGQKTILISTHDMEEADILGDRIAIMHAGKLKSYGTPMFLKKSLGKGNVEVTLSIEPWCDTERLFNELNSQGKISNKDGNRIIMSIPNSSNFPDWLDKMESAKSELGISGLSVSLITLEQVFIRVTQENEDVAKSYKPYKTTGEKLTGGKLLKQRIRALLHKKMIYAKSDVSTIIIMISLIFASLLSISLVLKETNVFKPRDKLVPVRLGMYNDPETYYKSYDDIFGREYKLASENFDGRATEALGSSLSDALINYGSKDFIRYNNHLIAAAEFNKTDKGVRANAMYSEKASYSFPISVNLLSNAIAKGLLDDNYSISLSSQNLPSLNSRIYTDNTTVNAFTTAVVFVLLFFPTISLFVLQPLRESLTNVKQLQRMAGVSGFIYWATNFLFDMIIFLFVIALIMIGFLSMALCLDLRMYEQNEILISLLLFVLFAINSLPLVYIFSFMNAATSSVLRLLTYIPMALVSMELVMCAVKAQLNNYQAVRILRPVQKRIFLFIPYLSFFHGQISFYTTAQKNSRCKRMPNAFYDTMCQLKNPDTDICCQLECFDGKCKKYVEYFTNFENDITLEESLMYLSLTPILYFGILVAMESQVAKKILAVARKAIVDEFESEEHVRREKLSIANEISVINKHNINGNAKRIDNCKTGSNLSTFQKQSSIFNDKNNQVFLVYELRKRYRKLMAVKDVSFGVCQHECFGLLGVNGAGKSTTFRIMTGAEIPDGGIMYIGSTSIKENRKHFLSQMGYCPQNDALISSVNAFDHLRLFARLRGIPELRVDGEVKKWIDKLNLNVCASQPSGTYSGGNKRRLNIAMALIGSPNLILLDEPTTGVDPGARRSLWNVIQSCQTMGQAIVLTSHSMEECEALCNRLGIMVGGRLVCIGSSQELKQRFGAGYDVQIKMNPQKAKDQLDKIKHCIANCELNFELTDENLGYLTYHIMPDNATWRKMYDIMDAMKIKYDCIDDFSVVSSTLEQLFLLFAKAADATQVKS